MDAKITFEPDDSIRFTALSGKANLNGEAVALGVDLGCGINLTYKGKSYRLTPEDIIAGLVRAIDDDDHQKRHVNY